MSDFDTAAAATDTHTLSLHDALPISDERGAHHGARETEPDPLAHAVGSAGPPRVHEPALHAVGGDLDRKSTRLNSSHVEISYAVFCLKKKTDVDHTQSVRTPPGRSTV